jgi:hypothetical protein
LSADDYTTEVTYVNLDTASQYMWATAAQRQEQPEALPLLPLAAETSWFAFMQIVHATPQHTSLQHHISVLVFAKEVDNPLASAVLVVQRKHVVYDQAVDRVVFALHVPDAGFVMAAKNRVLVGVCIKDRCVAAVWHLQHLHLFSFLLIVCQLNASVTRLLQSSTSC